ncbi:MAG: hypothetical protein LBG43_11060 [Treponema sp.]|nr:hypothetical protein [Treponema sp.]
MKRLAIIAFLALAVCAGSLFAEHPGGWGIGLQGGWAGGGGGGGLTLKAPKVPVYWTINLNPGWISVSGDYYFIDKALVSGAAGTLGWYLGLGGYVNIAYDHNVGYGYNGWYSHNYWFGIGAEVPIGLSWLPLNFLELYLQLVPHIGIGIYDNGVGLWPGVGGSLGLRFWF